MNANVYFTPLQSTALYLTLLNSAMTVVEFILHSSMASLHPTYYVENEADLQHSWTRFRCKSVSPRVRVRGP